MPMPAVCVLCVCCVVVAIFHSRHHRRRCRARTRCDWLLLLLVVVVVLLNECGFIFYCSIRWYSPYLWIKYERAHTIAPLLGTSDSSPSSSTSSTLCVAVEKAGHQLERYIKTRAVKYTQCEIFSPWKCVRARRRARIVSANVLPRYFVVISKPPSNLFKLASISVKCKRWWWKTRRGKEAGERASELDGWNQKKLWQKAGELSAEWRKTGRRQQNTSSNEIRILLRAFF